MPLAALGLRGSGSYSAAERPQSWREMILALPRDPFARQVPGSLSPEPRNARWLTIGWLLDGVKNHQIPAPTKTSARTLASNRFRLSFAQEHGPAPARPCRTLGVPVGIAFKKGDIIGIYDHVLLIRPANAAQRTGPPLLFSPADGSAVVVLRDTGPASLGPGNTGFFPTRICGPHLGAPGT